MERGFVCVGEEGKCVASGDYCIPLSVQFDIAFLHKKLLCKPYIYIKGTFMCCTCG